MRLEVLNTGSELLLGEVTNTHLAYFGQALLPLGLRVDRQVTVPDGPPIQAALLDAFGRCDILLITGGLGPTTDDVTREITAELLGVPLIENAEVLQAIQQRLERRNIPFRERMQRQAMVPENGTVLPNANGTAPGIYLPARETPAMKIPHLFLLPGPPRELQPMFETYAIPLLKNLAGTPGNRDCKVYHVVGLGESAVEERIGMSLFSRGDIEVGYCARPNEVDLRLIGDGEVLAGVEAQVVAALGDHLVSTNGATLEQTVVYLLQKKKKTLAAAESCTGGLLSHRITNVPGASEVFAAGFITYSNRAKKRAVEVPEILLRQHGAVSEPVASAMAEGVARVSKADYGIGITGIAGPGGGTVEKPVGTVFIAVAERDAKIEVRRECFPSPRETFKHLAVQTALNMLRLRLTEK